MRPKSPNQAAPAKPAGEPRFHSQPVERGLAEPRRSPSYLMRTLVFLLQIVAGCWAGSPQPTNTPLTFYVVSGKQMTGGRFIDTTNYPKLGYIAAKPDLVVKSLAGVYRAKIADHITHIDDKGQRTIVPVPTSPNLGVNLTPRDAKEFTALTKKAVGKRLLVMLGDRLLTAPLVLAPIETPSFSFSFPTESAMRKAEDDLKRLVQ